MLEILEQRTVDPNLWVGARSYEQITATEASKRVKKASLWALGAGALLVLSGSVTQLSPGQVSRMVATEVPSINRALSVQTQAGDLVRQDPSIHEQAAAAARLRPAVEVVDDQAETPIGPLAQDLRNLTGLTVQELAQMARVSPRTYYSWLAGKPISSARETRLLRLRHLIQSMAESLPQENVRRWFRAPHRSLGQSPLQALTEGQDDAVGTLLERFSLSYAT